MIKNDEKQLLEILQHRSSNDHNQPYVRQIVYDLNMNEKRAVYILEKWANKGWYEYGVNVLAGWLTDKGLAA